MTIERLTHKTTGELLAGFFVRNRSGKAVAFGAFSSDPFVTPTRKRYARDTDLCRAVAKLTGVPIKWNLTVYGNHVTSAQHGQWGVANPAASPMGPKFIAIFEEAE